MPEQHNFQCDIIGIWVTCHHVHTVFMVVMMKKLKALTIMQDINMMIKREDLKILQL